MFENLKTKWNAFKKNMTEYQHLCRKCAGAWHKFAEMRGKITVLYGIGGGDMRVRCIRGMVAANCSGMPMMACGSTDQMETLMILNQYCPHFQFDEIRGIAQNCNQASCPCHANNVEFVRAFGEYTAANEQCQRFWASVKTQNKTK